jgi:hypothetical protein
MSFLPNEIASTDSVSQKQHSSQQSFVQAQENQKGAKEPAAA